MAIRPVKIATFGVSPGKLKVRIRICGDLRGGFFQVGQRRTV